MVELGSYCFDLQPARFHNVPASSAMKMPLTAEQHRIAAVYRNRWKKIKSRSDG
ncbi:MULTISPECIES: hypothetical protein [unclassified Mesorhizobium]|uniref:hypothetical protein n=1 Tax=unclassified Mesorhizobium TaxID=325217 RepID=UPI0015E31AE4|nr:MULTISPECIES: hypothetical protein [unclassified Mesorhizobium]